MSDHGDEPLAPPPPPTWAGDEATPPAQGLSLASMISGIAGILLSLVGFGFLPALAAVITGHIAQKSQPSRRPFWLTGLIAGYVGIGIALIQLILAVVLIYVVIAEYTR